MASPFPNVTFYGRAPRDGDGKLSTYADNEELKQYRDTTSQKILGHKSSLKNYSLCVQSEKINIQNCLCLLAITCTNSWDDELVTVPRKQKKIRYLSRR
jgi:hypothetical protein